MTLNYTKRKKQKKKKDKISTMILNYMISLETRPTVRKTISRV